MYRIIALITTFLIFKFHLNIELPLAILNSFYLTIILFMIIEIPQYGQFINLISKSIWKMSSLIIVQTIIVYATLLMLYNFNLKLGKILPFMFPTIIAPFFSVFLSIFIPHLFYVILQTVSQAKSK